MRGFVLTEVGGTPKVQNFQEPKASEQGQAVVKVLAAGMNPVDRYMVQNPDPLPRVVGLEAIAENEDGKRVYVNPGITPFGTFAERTLTDQVRMIELLDSLEAGAALALGIAGMAAWLPLTWKAKLRSGESVLVLGATGVQGQIAVQAAKLLGAGHVVAAGRNRDVLESLKGRGADEIAVLEGDLSDALRKAAPSGGYQVVIDSVFGDPFAGLLDSGTLGADSRVVVLGGSAGQENKLAFRQLQALKGATIAGYSSFDVPMDARREAYLTMAQHVIDGKLSIDIKEYSLDQAAEAWEAQANGPHHKIVIVP